MRALICWLLGHNYFRLGDRQVCRRCAFSYRMLTDADIARESLRILHATMKNVRPSVRDVPRGWVCDVGGTPGVWREIK